MSIPKVTIKRVLVATLLPVSFGHVAVAAQPVTIVSWNMEWLSSQPTAKIAQSQRSAQDISGYRQLFNQLKPAILSFQEVNDVQIMRDIVGPDYSIFLSDRAQKQNWRYQFSDINQYTGFAVSKSLRVSDPQDLILSNKSKLRFASYIIIHTPSDRPVHLLSVHLKAGCTKQYRATQSSCRELKQQATKLAQWINQRNQNHDNYLILGDFNHNLSYPGDWMWGELIQNTVPIPKLVSRDTKAHCVVNGKNGKTVTYRSLIDHMVASPQLAIDNATQTTYPQTWLKQYHLSDHCPIVSTLK